MYASIGLFMCLTIDSCIHVFIYWFLDFSRQLSTPQLRLYRLYARVYRRGRATPHDGPAHFLMMRLMTFFIAFLFDAFVFLLQWYGFAWRFLAFLYEYLFKWLVSPSLIIWLCRLQ